MICVKKIIFLPCIEKTAKYIRDIPIAIALEQDNKRSYKSDVFYPENVDKKALACGLNSKFPDVQILKMIGI